LYSSFGFEKVFFKEKLVKDEFKKRKEGETKKERFFLKEREIERRSSIVKKLCF